MLPQAGDAGLKVGLATVYVAGGKKSVFNLTLAKGDATRTLLRPAVRTPRVVLTRTGVSMSALPPKVGIVEITLYTRNKTSPNALLKKNSKAKIGASVLTGGRAVKLSTIVTAQRH
jgi:hypothetical protein